MKKTILLYFVILIISSNSILVAQTDENSIKRDSIRSDANLRSGNFRDVFTNFFQLAFNDLTGPDKRLRFSSNLFALRLKINPDLNIDKFYKENGFYRNSNIDFDIKLDTSYNFNGISFGYKYAIVNKRDYTIAENFDLLIMAAIKDYKVLDNSVNEEIAKRYKNDEKNLTRLSAEWNSFTTVGSTKKFKDLSDELQTIITLTKLGSTLFKNDENFRDAVTKKYNEVRDTYKNKFLWTVGANIATYSDGLLLSNVDFTTEATQGIMEVGDRSNIEYDIKGEYLMLDNAFEDGRGLSRQTLAFEGGLNYVVRDLKNNKPFFEFKASIAYSSILNSAYINEKKEIFTLNGTLRFRFTDDLWIPLEFKYDPDNGNVLGLLSTKLNFD